MPQPLPTPFLTSTRGLDEGPRGPSGPAGAPGPAGPDGADGLPLPFNVLPGPEYISYGQVADVFPTTGLVRVGSSVGAGSVAPIVTWRRSSGTTHDLVTVRDVDSTFAEVVINGPTGSSSQTKITGNKLRIETSGGTIMTGTNLLFGNTALGGNDPSPSFGGGLGVTFIGDTTTVPTSGGPFIFRFGYGVATRFGGQGDIFAYDGGSTSRPDILARWTREEGHYGGAANTRIRTRGLFGCSGTIWNERFTSFGPGPNGNLIRYWMPDETVTTLDWVVTMCRTTSATKGGTFRGRATLRRTGAGIPVHVGLSPQYEADVETTAGDGVDIFIHPVAYDPDPFSGFGLVYEVQIRPITADSDGRRWFMRCDVDEVRGT